MMMVLATMMMGFLCKSRLTDKGKLVAIRYTMGRNVEYYYFSIFVSRTCHLILDCLAHHRRSKPIFRTPSHSPRRPPETLQECMAAPSPASYHARALLSEKDAAGGSTKAPKAAKCIDNTKSLEKTMSRGGGECVDGTPERSSYVREGKGGVCSLRRNSIVESRVVWQCVSECWCGAGLVLSVRWTPVYLSELRRS